jgi:hypothetical protein
VSSSRMTSNQEVTIRLVLCAVGVPDFTGVENIFRLTVGQSRMTRAHHIIYDNSAVVRHRTFLGFP